jgi:hypothetical protein
MRTVFAVALCLVVGACAGEPDPYGSYDIVSVDGEDWTADQDMNGWYEIRPDGTGTLAFDIAAQPDLEPTESEFNLGEMTDGCIPWSAADPETGVEWTGSICGEVFTIQGAGQTVVMHKRR